jgi:uncharacterized membrane protein
VSRQLFADLFFVVTLLWVLLLAALPSVVAERGTGERMLTAATLVYVLGGFICHQRPDRSFQDRGVSFPVCGRCFGLYAGAPFGALLGFLGTRPRWMAARGRRISTAAWRSLLAVAAVPTIITVIVEYSGLDPGTLIRSIAAVPLGLAVAWLVASAIGSDPEVHW